MRIWFVASELAPFAQTGGLGQAIGALANALVERDHRVTVILPLYRPLIEQHIGDSGPSHTCSATLAGRAIRGALRVIALENGVELITVDHRDLYDRPALYGAAMEDYPDNPLRFAFLCQAALQAPRLLGVQPDVFHCHDWQTALVPFYARTRDAEPAATVLTIHNLGYQGICDKQVVEDCELGWEAFTPEGIEFYDRVNLLKAGLVTADRLTTVSPQYARDIQTEQSGWALHGVLQQRGADLEGILNGVDDDVWNPETDERLPAHYSSHSLEGKALCRHALAEECGWKTEPSGPIFCVVSRLVHQKGTSLLPGVVDAIRKVRGALVVLGSGDPHEEERLRQTAAHAKHVYVRFGYDEAFAHRILAGADALLMPSRYEPCGLTQLFALRYGTVPIVRATGGLIDTVEPFNADTNTGTGFAFSTENNRDDELQIFAQAIRDAADVFTQQNTWHALQTRGMQKRFTWAAAAAAYESAYTRAIAARNQRTPLPWQSP